MARPQKDPEAMNRAIRLVAGGLSAEDASAAIGGKLAPSTIANEAARRRKARPAALGPSSAIVLTQGQPAPAARPSCELVVMVGIPGSGKSTLARLRWGASHVFSSKDAIGGSDRAEVQRGQIGAALAAGRSVVADNTNATAEERAPLVALARRHGARVVAVQVLCEKAIALERNKAREGVARVPDVAIHTIAKKLEAPRVEEGFAAVFQATALPGGGFDVVEAVAPSLAALLQEPEAPAPLPADRLERAEQVRRVLAAGDLAPDTIDRLALTWSCSPDEVRRVFQDAATLSPGQALPQALALDESRALARRVRKKAEDAADWKSALAAQAHLDKLAGLDAKTPTAPGAGHVARSEVIATLRRCFAALAPWPEAQAAFRGAVQG